MITLRPQSADAAELLLLERRFRIGWAVAGLVVGGNVASVVLMLLASA